MIGISIKPSIGLGDALQFSSVPENYFRATGQKLFDVDRPWFFDHNPFVEREKKAPELERVQQMWNFSPTQYQWPNPRRPGEPKVYLSNAEIHAAVFGVPAKLIRPRLYRFEDVAFEKREMILLHVDGKSHGDMPDEIIEHILKKYMPTKRLFQIGLAGKSLGIPRIETPSLWDLAKVISEARMLIGVDSGPSWIAACYPDVLVKKVRTKPRPEYFKDWVPLEIQNVHSHWDDRCHQIFNPTKEDVGFTSAYTRI